MKQPIHPILVLVVVQVLLAGATHAAQTTLFSYQGRLHTAAGPATGLYDLRFELYANGTGGTPITTPNLFTAWPVTAGVFNVTLDFGNEFPGAVRWLGIAVRTNGTDDFVALEPRQRLTPTPYAIHAMNAGTVAGTHFIGTTDSRPLDLRAANSRALRLEFNGTSPNVIGGHSGNSVINGAHGGTIGGGGRTEHTNVVGGIFGTVGGGERNMAIGPGSTIGGGQQNASTGWSPPSPVAC